MPLAVRNRRRIAMVLVFVLVVCTMITAVQPALADDVFDKIIKDSSTDGSYIKENPFTGSDVMQPGKVIDKSQLIAQIIMAVCIIISIVCLVINIARLAMNGDNEKGRKSAQSGILYSGIALAMFGSLTWVVSIFWNFF